MLLLAGHSPGVGNEGTSALGKELPSGPGEHWPENSEFLLIELQLSPTPWSTLTFQGITLARA